MNNPSYVQQYDKLTIAYIENRLAPFDNCACFIGNLLNGKREWNYDRLLGFNDNPPYLTVIAQGHMQPTLKEQCNNLYTPQDIADMESCFLNTYFSDGGTRMGDINENALFIAFEKTLDLLKEIHIKNGEVVDQVPALSKRNLSTTFS